MVGQPASPSAGLAPGMTCGSSWVSCLRSGETRHTGGPRSEARGGADPFNREPLARRIEQLRLDVLDALPVDQVVERHARVAVQGFRDLMRRRAGSGGEVAERQIAAGEETVAFQRFVDPRQQVRRQRFFESRPFISRGPRRRAGGRPDRPPCRKGRHRHEAGGHHEWNDGANDRDMAKLHADNLRGVQHDDERHHPLRGHQRRLQQPGKWHAGLHAQRASGQHRSRIDGGRRPPAGIAASDGSIDGVARIQDEQGKRAQPKHVDRVLDFRRRRGQARKPCADQGGDRRHQQHRRPQLN